jgi:hypothetical protein
MIRFKDDGNTAQPASAGFVVFRDIFRKISR